MDDSAKARSGRSVLIALFVVYIVLLAWIVLWKLAVPWIGGAALLPHPIKWIPFLPTSEADASAPLEVVANILLFAPFGIYLGLLAPTWSWWKAAAIFAGTSVMFETTQQLLSIGTADTTDVISNTAGGLLGLGLMALARRRLGSRAPTVLTKVLIVGTALSLLAIVIFIASPLRYAPQPDVVVPKPTASTTTGQR